MTSNMLASLKFDEICRTCLKKAEPLIYLYNMDSANLDEMLKFCTSISLHENDGLPNKICALCIEELSQAYNFTNKCKTNDDHLREYLKSCYNFVVPKLENDSSNKDFETTFVGETSLKSEDIDLKSENILDNNDFSENSEEEMYYFHNINACSETLVEVNSLNPNQNLEINHKNITNLNDSINLNLENDTLSNKTKTNDESLDGSKAQYPVAVRNERPLSIKRMQLSAATVKEEMAKLLPEKSREAYEREYELFVKWKNTNKIGTNTNEQTLIAYFDDKSKRTKSSCIWSYYSMLKKTLLVREKIDISRYNLLISILKSKTKGYKPTKSLVFETKDVLNFWKEASDDDYLLEKVISIMGIFGACRSCELHGLTVEDVDDRGHIVMVNLRDTKTYVDRNFGIVGNENGVNPLDIIRKYMYLRPKHVAHNFFFLNYRNRKCTVQRVGINKLYKTPERIANYLKLDTPAKYTGHCFRRSSATILANSGGDFLAVKKIGGWKSLSVAE